MKILVVDDQFVVRQLIRDELEAGGYEVFEAASGQEALIKLVQNPVDLVTLDVEMPGMDGYKTCARLRSDRYKRFISSNSKLDLPVIFVTSLDSPEERQKGFAVGALDYFSKPFAKGSILKAVDKILKPNQQYNDLFLSIIYNTENIRVNLSNLAIKQGIQFMAFKSFENSLRWMEQNHQSLGLILIENSEDSPALGILQKMQKNPLLKQTPNIVFWNHQNIPNLLQLYKSGCSDSVQVPFLQEELSQKITLHLNHFGINKERSAMLSQLEVLDGLKDRFLDACSHDLRTPINSILGLTELLLEDIHEEEHQGFLKMIKSSCSQMSQMIESLLSISKIKSGTLEIHQKQLNLHNELQFIAKKYQRDNSKNLDYHLDFQLKNPMIITDLNSFHRIIDNLLSNATKFTPRSGKIEIQTNNLDDIFYQIHVKDSGIGIPKASLPYLFDEYSQIGRKGTEGEPSIGLGMSITKTLIDNLGGIISVESKEQVGTNFTVTLPLGGRNG
ncbi:hybrid sensor histidine kinase/response regulator [bacterium]|nr:hybrid sensor histidine kinase/response regulator [bacterium]